MTDAGPTRASLYARLPVTEAVGWWRRLAAASVDGRVLELGAGTGRITAALAEVADVTAVDVDPESLDVLRERVAGVRVVEADVRALDLGERYGVVLLPVALLNEVGDLADRRATMQVVHRHLAEDGVVALEVLNPLWLLAGGESSGVLEGDGERVRMTAAHRPGEVWSQHVRADLTYRFGDGASFRDRLDAHAVFPAELELLLDGIGLEVVDATGADPDGGPPRDDDGSWYVVARPASR